MTRRARKSLSPTLQGFGPAIRWLSDVGGVSQERLARLFETSVRNIAVIKHREKANRQNLEPLRILNFEPTPEGSHPHTVRPSEFEALIPHSGVETFDSHVQKCFETHRDANTYAEGIRDLLRLKPYVGFPSRIEFRRVLGKIKIQIAWFRSHSGFSEAAALDALSAFEIYRDVFNEDRGPQDLRAMAECARIIAHSQSLGGDPTESLKALRFIKHTATKIGSRLDADFYRQRGVAYFQLGDDVSAEQDFKSSMHSLEDSGEGTSRANILHHGTRHTALMHKPKWEDSRDVLAEVEKTFGANTMHYSVNTHWTVACALGTRSPELNREALELLQKNKTTATQFGHQLTISKLLEITPDLGLSPGLLPIWIRKALYFNATRNR